MGILCVASRLSISKREYTTLAKYFRWLVLGIILWWLGFEASLAANPVVHLTSGEFPPWLSAHLKYEGVASRIIRDAFAKVGYDVEFHYYPWGRSFYLAQMGEFNGTAVWQKNAKREKDFYFSDPVVQSKIVFFHLKNLTFDWKSFTDLKPYTISATAGYAYGLDFDRSRVSIPLRVYDSIDDYLNLKKILMGRYQLSIMDYDVAMYLLHTQFKPEEVDRVIANTKIVGQENLYLLLNKKDPNNARVIEKFNKGLVLLKAEGLINRYLMESRQSGHS